MPQNNSVNFTLGITSYACSYLLSWSLLMEPWTLPIEHLKDISISSSVSLITSSSTKNTSLVSSWSSGVRAISNGKEPADPSVLGLQDNCVEIRTWIRRNHKTCDVTKYSTRNIIATPMVPSTARLYGGDEVWSHSPYQLTKHCACGYVTCTVGWKVAGAQYILWLSTWQVRILLDIY